MIRSRWLIILLGQDKTGKTTLQKELVQLLSGKVYDKLDCNRVFAVTYSGLAAKLQEFSVGNRSYQEKKTDYESIEQYFSHHFRNTNLAIISSHLKIDDIEAMIAQGHRRFYNVAGLFFTNSIKQSPEENARISELPWDERLVASNDQTDNPETWKQQIRAVAQSLIGLLEHRANTIW